MKKIFAIALIAFLIVAGTTARAQVDRNDELLGLPGDNLNLYAVMKLFQESATLEDFEKRLNDKNSGINNLDLNGDNLVDYITVNDYVDGNVHNIVLRVALNRSENQDVAVFTVQKFSNGSVQLQLVGDKALYGKDYIIEPNYAENNYADNSNADNNYSGNNAVTPNPGYTGEVVIRTTGLEVAAWSLVRLLFLPGYIVWHSLFCWDNYPYYWEPWHPWYPEYYCGYHSYWDPFYYGHYRRWNECRYNGYNDFYFGGIRTHSPMVDNMIRGGNYRNSYSHPEMRREGALSARMNHSRNEGMRSDANVGRGLNNSGFESGRFRTGESASFRAGRQSETTMSGRSAMNSRTGMESGNSRRSGGMSSSPSAYGNKGFSQRSSGNVNNRQAGIASVQNSISSRRSSGTLSGRYASASSANKSAGISQRSSGNMTNRSARYASSQNGISSRKSGGIFSGRSSSTPSAYRSSGLSQRSSGNMSARSGRNSSFLSGSSSRSASSFSARSSSGGRSGSFLKSAGMSSGRSGASFRSSGGSGRSSGGGMARSSSGGGGGSRRGGGHSGGSGRR